MGLVGHRPFLPRLVGSDIDPFPLAGNAILHSPHPLFTVASCVFPGLCVSPADDRVIPERGHEPPLGADEPPHLGVSSVSVCREGPHMAAEIPAPGRPRGGHKIGRAHV